MLFHILRHIQTDQRLRRIEQLVGEHFNQLRLSDTGRADENERCRSASCGHLDAAALDRTGQCGDGFLLSDDMRAEMRFQVAQLGVFGFLDLVGGNSRPDLNDMRQIACRNLHLDRIRGQLVVTCFQVNHLALALCQQLIIRIRIAFDVLNLLLLIRNGRGQPLHFGQLRVLDADIRTALVQQVDRFVRQEPVCDIALREHRAEPQHRRRNLHAMEFLVILRDALQDLNSILYGRFIDLDRLETAFQRTVLFDIFSVFGKGRRTDDLHLTAGQCRLEDIRGIHRAFGIAGADQAVNLVNKQDDIPLLLDLLNKSLDSALKLSSELRTCDQRGHVQQIDLLVFQVERHVTGCDAERDTLRNGGLADARLTDQAGIVLLSAGEDLNHARNLGITPDHAVHQAVFRTLAEIRAVAVQIFQFFFALPLFALAVV